MAGGGRAEAGAPELDRFVDGIRAVHGSEHRHVTVIGHSYGSTVVGEAAKRPGGLAADDLVVVGSSGMRVDNIDQLQIERRHVWAAASGPWSAPQGEVSVGFPRGRFPRPGESRRR
ncbi:hypothetical protein C3Y87_10405 [Carbonactinospora thermoautotrophica]|uniref:alpha/beta hydrolase n=1 Tax=Carbonactinospora thermoautotrophica TaxID=1469144 RepID=UPI003DA9FD54|nr:hypothetical protein [Carbonactinospora thermoautotrophica]